MESASNAVKTGCSYNEWLSNREQGFRWCYRCKSWKVKRLFAKDKSWSGGYASLCKECNSDRSICSKYNIHQYELDEIRSKTIKCPICFRVGQKMEIDRNHKTGKLRGFICSRCNGALGQFCDDISLLEKAIKYLQNTEHGRKQ